MIQRQTPGKKPNSTFPGKYTAAQLAVMMDVHMNTIWDWKKAKKIPEPSWHCGRFVWDKDVIDNLILKFPYSK